MKIVVRPLAERDLEEAGAWYEERRQGLKQDFFRAVEAAFFQIEENPRLYPAIHLDIRRATLERFPYGIYYALIQGKIHILGIIHDARHPSVWRRRR